MAKKLGLVVLMLMVAATMLLAGCGGKKEEKKAVAPVSAPAPIPNKGEMVAAIAAAIAEDLGTDVKGIRIKSIKKI